MSSRISFAVHDASGLKTDLVGGTSGDATCDFKVYKGAVLQTMEVTANNDGTYYFDISVSGIYTVKIKSTEQDEFETVYLPTDDLVKQTDVDDTTIEYSSGLKVKDNTYSLVAHTHDDDYLAIGTFDVLDFKVTSSDIKLKDRSTIGGTLMDATKSLLTNLRAIADKAVLNAGKITTLESVLGITTAAQGANKRSVYTTSRVAGTSTGDAPAAANSWYEVATAGVLKFACPFYMYEGDTTLVLRFTAQMTAGFTGVGGTITVNSGDGASYGSGDEGSTVFTNTDMTEVEVSVDISGSTVGRMHEIQVRIHTSDATKQVEVSRYITIDVY